MSYSNDPGRWTAGADDAPDALRAPLEAAGREAPSDQQMKALALKLAALGVGTAAAASAATAKAAAGTAAAGAKSAGVLTLTKVLASLAVVGAVGAGAVMLRRSPEAEPAPAAKVSAPTELSPSADVAPAAQAPAAAPGVSREAAELAPATAEQPSDAAERPPAGDLSPESAESPRQAAGQPRETARVRPVAARERTSTKRERAHQPAKHTLGVKVVEPAASMPSEVELLRQARAALAGRPREAFALTEQHRQHYAHGTFVQERDALAIEALLRAGELDMARDLARRFVRDYPGSPHAHRFREKMGL